MIIKIPFGGFYDSIHSWELDRELENMVSDSSGCHPVSARILDDLYSHIQYPFSEYSRKFVEDFEIYLNAEASLDVKLTYESVSSPREYNFGTDRIFAKISKRNAAKLYRKCDKTILDRIIKERFTSYDGFISFYDANRNAWGALNTWDHNQLECILLALIEQFFNEDWEQSIIEDWSGNGIISNWMYEGLDDEGKRLIKIADYLIMREERQYRKQATA